MSNSTAETTKKITRRMKAFARFKEAHPRYHGGFLNDCFIDDACEALRLNHPSYLFGLDPEDERWDKVCPAMEPVSIG